jgi:hypothetical protein
MGKFTKKTTFILVIFLWVAINPCMIQASKEIHVLLSRSLSGQVALLKRPNARNADVVCICAMSLSVNGSVASVSRHVNYAWSMVCQCMERVLHMK